MQPLQVYLIYPITSTPYFTVDGIVVHPHHAKQRPYQAAHPLRGLATAAGRRSYFDPAHQTQ